MSAGSTIARAKAAGIASEVLTSGNTAKLYCLNWLDARIGQYSQPFTLLDLGSGQSLNFIPLLRKHPHLTYVGVEPSAKDCKAAREHLQGLNATLVNSWGYDLSGELPEQSFDFITSFSVLEHVYQRRRYLESAKSLLKPSGRFLINYDAGHFVHPADLRERMKTLVAPLLAPLGREDTYQRFVSESEFQGLLHTVGLQVIEAKMFNTRLKHVYKRVPSSRRAEYMSRWLEFELWLNDIGITYSDGDAHMWSTRNYILAYRRP